MSIIWAWQRAIKWIKEDKGWVLYSMFLLIIAVVILRDNRIKSERLNKIIESEGVRLTEITQIKEQMISTLNNFKNTQVLGETTIIIPTPTSVPVLSGGGIIEVKAEIATANIYESPMNGTTVLGTKVANEILFYKKFENGWYEVNLIEQGKDGWIQAELVNEIKS